MSGAPAALHPGTRGVRNRKAAAGISRGDRREPGKVQSTMAGAVTAEFAVALPAVLLLLALLLSGAAAGVTQLRLEEAALAGGRALARGEDPAAAEGIVRALAGTSATVSVAADGEWLHVTVADRAGGPLASTLPWTLTAKASARREMPTAAGPPRPGPLLQERTPVTNLKTVACLERVAAYLNTVAA
ncbi:TadE family type IV pilus minor pilin [Pseudarthrobacter sp. H3Y2-7]|uniref:TadE family type IV pilus minor pilin n=1 Tax=Pseudarthrobacter naphthalenicus TaxID=3031328 RepID=UPI0023B04563|nr:TadE family type IV pilus minor pilin [Pseudarthrobacter sp. H3Y2-7]MDE8668009.1 TadE family type IV pilus minor pilin [Pseudarthrobacter sp. H3Y2-7]